MCVGRVWCLTRAELRPRPAAAQSTPRPLKMSTKFREIVLKSKIHRHLYSNNRGSVSETVFNTKNDPVLKPPPKCFFLRVPLWGHLLFPYLIYTTQCRLEGMRQRYQMTLSNSRIWQVRDLVTPYLSCFGIQTNWRLVKYLLWWSGKGQARQGMALKAKGLKA